VPSIVESIQGNEHITELRPEQYDLVEFLWNNPAANVLEVLPCGAGKTLPVLVLGLLYQEYRPNDLFYLVVLCPFKCVVAEWLEKCAKVQNRNFCHVVHGNNSLEISAHAKIVLISCDALAFSYGLSALNYLGQHVARYVVDEAHVIYQDSKTYRLRLNRIPQLTQFLPRPYLLLSGTYSPELERSTSAFYNCDPWTVFRYPTDRQHIKICIQALPSKASVLHAVERFLEVFNCYASASGNSRAMVFVGTKREAEEWSEYFGRCGFRTGIFFHNLP
jgi:superfamily II DNA helicase RecQ